jgi:hypothetical protein
MLSQSEVKSLFNYKGGVATTTVVYRSEDLASLNEVGSMAQSIVDDFRSGVVEVEVDPYMHFSEREAVDHKMKLLLMCSEAAEDFLESKGLLREFRELHPYA